MSDGKLQQEIDELKKKLREANQTLNAMRKGEVDAVVVKGPQGEQLYSIITPEQPYKLFIENIEDGAVIITKEGVILYSNNGFHHLVGLNKQSAVGTSILNYMPENQRQSFLKKIVEPIKGKIEYKFLSINGSIVYTTLSISKEVWRDSDNICLLISDVTDLKESLQRSECSQTIIKILSEAPTLGMAFDEIIAILNEFFGWEVIVLWSWDPVSQTISSSQISSIQGIDIEPFAKKTGEMKKINRMLSRKVLTSYRPIWFEDVLEQDEFIQKEEAALSGLHGYLAFPFFKKSQLSGIIELFRRPPLREEVSDATLNLFVSLGIDIGLFLNRKSAEENTNQLSSIIAYSVNGIFSTDLEGNIKSWNPGAERVYGWKSSEVIGRNIKILYPPDRIQEYDDTSKKILSAKAIESFETKHINKDNTIIWVDNAYGPVLNSLGDPIGTYIVVQDITDRKATRQRLIETQKKLESFIELSEEWICELDPQGNFIFSSREVERILGYSQKNLIGKSILYYIDPHFREQFEIELKKHIRRKEGWVGKLIQFSSKKRETAWLEGNCSAKVNEKNELVGFQLAMKDITEAKNLEKSKNEFISVVSHELRTPLTSIYGALTLLTTTGITLQEREKLIITAQRNSERLNNLINDIIDIEKLQLNRFDLNLQKVKLSKVVLESINNCEVLANKEKSKILLRDPSPDVDVNADCLRLSQVMINLLSNAIKFSPVDGIVEVWIEVYNNVARVSIKDQGPGVPENFKKKIFEKFAQADSSTQRSTQGTGLGLNISKSIIERHGGSIGFDSIAGKGAVFYFELPIFREEELL